MSPVTTWPDGDLCRIAATDDLHIAPFREDGVTPGTFTWIWSVVVDGGLYVRAYNGQRSRWYRAAIRHGAGRIRAAGRVWDVAFTPAEGAINDRIDEAYRLKYGTSPYLSAMTGSRARAATVRITPRDARRAEVPAGREAER